MNLKRWLKYRSDLWSPWLVGALIFMMICFVAIVRFDVSLSFGCPRYCDIPQHRTLILSHHGQQLWFKMPLGYGFDITEFPERPEFLCNDLVKVRTFQAPIFNYLYHVAILMDVGAVFRVIAFVENTGRFINCWIYEDGIPILSTEDRLEWLIEEYYGTRALL